MFCKIFTHTLQRSQGIVVDPRIVVKHGQRPYTGLGVIAVY